MSGLELLVIVVGGLAGYWLVGFLFKSRKAAPDPQSDSTESDQSGQRHGNSSDSSSQKAPDWHEVLGVSPQASGDEIRFAYKRLITQYHPDKVASLGPELRDLANRKSQEITFAYRSAMLLKGETV